MKKILFVCSANKDRSPTAENIYKNKKGLKVKSAGTLNCAQTPLTADLLQWADIVLCMSKHHQKHIEDTFPEIIASKTIDSLNIADVYSYMEPLLIKVITEKVDAWLRENQVKTEL